jgi:aminobenzoyl-glutamate utilization protein A
MTFDVTERITNRFADWTAFRRDLHRFPELGFTEYRTISKIAAHLAPLGYRLRFGAEVMARAAMIGTPTLEATTTARRRALANGADAGHLALMPDGMTGLVAELSRGEGPVVAIRVDVDALPLHEDGGPQHPPARLGFVSGEPGMMHACGHDGHATIGIALAELAADPDAQWRGTLRLIFQPAEEGGRGARPMVEAGVVDDAGWFFALHIGCDLPSGQIATMASEMMFSAKWDVTLAGRAAHAAGNPEDGRNALLAAAQLVQALYALPRHGLHATHVNVGTLKAGTARNVVADRAEMAIELRGNAEAGLTHMEGRARQLIEAIALSQGCTATIEELGRTIGETATPVAARLVADIAASLPGVTRVLDAWPLGGGDDAAFFMQRVKQHGGETVYFVLGSDLAAGHHATTFDFTEADICTGARLFYELLCASTAK